MEKMDPRDDRTSTIRAEFKTFLGNRLKSSIRPVSPTQQPSTLPPNVSNNNINNSLIPGPSQDIGSPKTPSGPQLPPLSFSAIDPATSTPNSVQAPEKPPTTNTERSNFTIHERVFSFLDLSTTNRSPIEQKSQPPPLSDAQTQQAIPLEDKATSSSDTPTPIPTPTPSMLMVNTKITKTETKPEPSSLTVDTRRSTSTRLTNPHHSPTATVLTNPHYSPTQSVFTNPHPQSPTTTIGILPNPNSSSESPCTVKLNHSPSLPLRDLDNSTSPALVNPSSPIPRNIASPATVISSSVKSEGSTSTSSQYPISPTGSLYSSPFDKAQDSSIASSVNSSSLTINLTQPFPNILLEKARTKTQDTIINQSPKSPLSANHQHQTAFSKYHNEPLPTPSGSSQKSQQSQPSSFKSQHDNHDHVNKFTNEADALHYMQQSETPSVGGSEKGTLPQQPAQRQNLLEKDNINKDQAETSTSSQAQAKNTRTGGSLNSPTVVVKLTGEVPIDSNRSSVQRDNTMSAVVDTSSTKPLKASAGSHVVGRLSPARSGLGRKPSGARAQFTPRSYGAEFSSQTLTEEEEEDSMSEHRKQHSQTALAYDDADAEALAALTYLDITDSQEVSASATPPSPPHHHSPLTTVPSTNAPKFQLSDRSSGPVPPTMSSSDSLPFRSSFAPSNKVAERKLKAQAQQAAYEAAKHRPGRANGKKKVRASGAWESSEEEEEEEEEEDDDDVDSDPEVPKISGPQSTYSSSSSAKPPQSSQYGDSNPDHPPSHLRPPRHLPPVPGRAGKRLRSISFSVSNCSNSQTLYFHRFMS